MLEKEKYRFMDISGLQKTEGIETRADESYIRNQLEKRFPEEKFSSIKVTLYDQRSYGQKSGLLDRLWGNEKYVTGLPAFYEVSLNISTGLHEEELIVWSPLAWNDRFAGTAGGGIGIGGRSYLTAPNNTQRGWTVPYAVINGFTAATIYAANTEGLKDFTIHQDGSLNRELYENWCYRSTHHMTVFGKAIAEILHGRPVKYSYMNGGSGGGRQSLMEVQMYPDDYDGVWASCPAINWNDFILGGFWPYIVMKEKKCFIDAETNQFFIDAVHSYYGGKEAYYHMQERPVFDAKSLIGTKGPHGVISETQAEVMNEIWRGPHTRDGDFLWYGYYPGVKNWQKVIPIGAYYYPLLKKNRIKPFILAEYYAKWITEDPSFKMEDLDWDKLVDLINKGREKFSDNLGFDAKIDRFAEHGGKLMIDHGMDDPLIPVEGTIDYYEKLRQHFGKDELDSFCRVFITPGDNHGNCWGNGAGITESDGLSYLIKWVEHGEVSDEIRKVRVDRKSGKTLEEGIQKAYGL
ncbi:MAG: tannase/feruloyl esterase family alpha/beta hydrolase [Erysipelotrichaceae bacterium]|nr:tannase/feruloyl esterase family alpha/beta hydrolase [Erysipelotrichaceae bacterium]